MKWIDLHCDTLSILTGGADTGIERCRAGLRENNLCVDARRLKEAGAAAQFFACYVNASDFCNGEVSRNGEIWDRAYRKILSMTAYAACAQDERFRIARYGGRYYEYGKCGTDGGNPDRGGGRRPERQYGASGQTV